MQLKHLGTANDDFTIGAGSKLFAIDVTTAVASAVVTVYDGTTTSDPVLAVIDAASKGGGLNYAQGARGGARSTYIKLTAGNAKITVAYG